MHASWAAPYTLGHPTKPQQCAAKKNATVLAAVQPKRWRGRPCKNPDEQPPAQWPAMPSFQQGT
eukprot:359876-Chlamydomonas_euryale.AAC.4